ncbi:PKD domain-containing protein [Candidatus Woesearchaeota archaeon]|nr:PKD domain-containing protein [Candidatus Woesearchaeota archaeon]
MEKNLRIVTSILFAFSLMLASALAVIAENDTVPAIPACTDTDQGLNFNLKGFATGNNGNGAVGTIYDACFVRYANGGGYQTASCSGDNCALEEATCSGNYIATYSPNGQGVSCPYGCNDGACLISAPLPVVSTISVVTPYGGESWMLGHAYTIGWKTSSVPTAYWTSKPVIELVDSNGQAVYKTTATSTFVGPDDSRFGRTSISISDPSFLNMKLKVRISIYDTNNNLAAQGTSEGYVFFTNSGVAIGCGQSTSSQVRNPLYPMDKTFASLSTLSHPEILKYRIMWGGGWSDWYTPGINDVDWKTNDDGTRRRVWAYFNDHTHEIMVCGSEPAPANKPPVITSIGGPVSLQAQETGTWKISAYDPDGNYLAYEISWGDENLGAPVSADEKGGFQSSGTFQHTYYAPGYYTITFAAIDDKGATTKSTLTVQVGQSVQQADLTIGSISIQQQDSVDSQGRVQVKINGMVQNIGTATSAPYNVILYVDNIFMNSGNGYHGLTPGETEGPDNVGGGSYYSPGWHTVKFYLQPTGADKDSSNNIAEEKFYVSETGNKAPVIDSFTGPGALNVNEVGTWGISAHDPDGALLTFTALWGDETNEGTAKSVPLVPLSPGTTATMQHQYSSAGDYIVTFTVRDETGLTAVQSHKVSVSDTGDEIIAYFGKPFRLDEGQTARMVDNGAKITLIRAITTDCPVISTCPIKMVQCTEGTVPYTSLNVAGCKILTCIPAGETYPVEAVQESMTETASAASGGGSGGSSGANTVSIANAQSTSVITTTKEPSIITETPACKASQAAVQIEYQGSKESRIFTQNEPAQYQNMLVTVKNVNYKSASFIVNSVEPDAQIVKLNEKFLLKTGGKAMLSQPYLRVELMKIVAMAEMVRSQKVIVSPTSSVESNMLTGQAVLEAKPTLVTEAPVVATRYMVIGTVTNEEGKVLKFNMEEGDVFNINGIAMVLHKIDPAYQQTVFSFIKGTDSSVEHPLPPTETTKVSESETEFASGSSEISVGTDEVSKGEVSKKCDGCVKGNLCLSVGLRTRDSKGAATYCDLDTAIKYQKEIGQVCDNNFECQTNTCNSGSCVDLQKQLEENMSMMQKIAAWFERIFG